MVTRQYPGRRSSQSNPRGFSLRQHDISSERAPSARGAVIGSVHHRASAADFAYHAIMYPNASGHRCRAGGGPIFPAPQHSIGSRIHSCLLRGRRDGRQFHPMISTLRSTSFDWLRFSTASKAALSAAQLLRRMRRSEPKFPDARTAGE